MASDTIHYLNAVPSRDVAEASLSPGVRRWFASYLGEPTAAQRLAWPAIAAGDHLLLSSPTGSGKTLAAFLPILSTLITEPSSTLQCLYVSPLKALCRDATVNLKRVCRRLGDESVRIAMRTGDTSQRVRRHHLRRPPAILMTTPESLAQMLAHGPSHQLFRDLRWIVVDEVHALIGSKRGADLAISMERLERLTARERVQRIGLSATCTPLQTVAEFLVGDGQSCSVAQVRDVTEKRFVVEPLFESLDYSPGWMEALLERLHAELSQCRTTLVFTNTRHLSERLTWALRRRYPERAHEIGVHHSALSAARRRVVERRMKHGKLWAIVSSTSLELGIDIGTVDSVVFVHPPGGVVRLLQRVGRSGHRPDQPRRGLLLTASPSELLESAVTAISGLDGQLEPVHMIAQPFDVLCQQLVGMAMTGLWEASAAYDLIRRAAPFRDLGRRDFDDCLDYLSGRRRDGSEWLPARLAWEGDCFTIADRRTARLLQRNLGTILTEDARAIRLRARTDGNGTLSVGELDQAYADRLKPGDRFVLDGRCLELRERESDAFIVEEVFGRPQIPRWLGGGVPMPGEIARRIFLFRAQAAESLRDGEASLHHWLRRDFQLNDSAITSLTRHIASQEMVSEVPTLDALLIEAVPMQACVEYFVHTPLSRSVNEVLARVLSHRARKSPITAMAADLGIYVLDARPMMLSATQWRSWLSPIQFEEDFRRHMASSDLCQQAFGRIAQTGLMILRNPAGRKRKVGGKDWAERRLYEQLREQDPDFVLLRQAETEVLASTCNLGAALRYVGELPALRLQLRTLLKPSPFGECLLRGTTTTITSEPMPVKERAG